MYYIGTKDEVDAYNEIVTSGENYQGTTSKWAEPIKHPTQDAYAIIKHPNYSVPLNELQSLTEDWYE